MHFLNSAQVSFTSVAYVSAQTAYFRDAATSQLHFGG
jgi:hypothetical protein